MQKFKKSLQNFGGNRGEKKFLEAYIHKKSNAKLGDSLVNFIYSVAKSIVSEMPTGTKVSDSILSEAYRRSLWYSTNTLKLKGKKDRIADTIEALILYFWVHEELSLEKLINPLITKLEPDRLHHPKEEYYSAVISFQRLLDFLYNFYLEREKKL
ncbi:MAG: ribonuclease III family protein [Candidatus Hodarchaeota archaeon]